MRRRSSILLCLVAAACGHATLPPPAPVFPLATAWTVPLDQPIEGPLAVTGDRVIVHTRDGVLRALASVDGKLSWRAEGGPGLLGAGASVIVLRAPDGGVRGFAPDTGRPLWQAATSVEGELPPVVDGTRVLVAGRGAAVLDAASGRTIWSVTGGAQATAPPAQAGPCVLIGESDILRCRESGTGRSAWVYRALGAISSPPVSDGKNRLLVGTAGREFLGLDLDDGNRAWRWKVGADVRWPAVVWRELVIFATHENVLYGLKRGGGSMVWRAGLPSRPLAAPLLVGQDVLVACYGSRPEENYIVGYDAATGERLGDLLTPGELAGAPQVAAGRLFLPLRDRRVVALRLPMPAPPPTPAPRRASIP